MKSRTISKRLTFNIVLLMLSFSAILLLANSLLLKPLYYYSVKKDMIQGMEKLEEIDIFSETNAWINTIENTNQSHSYGITIEYDGEIIYSSSREFGIKEPGEFEQKGLNGDFTEKSPSINDFNREAKSPNDTKSKDTKSKDKNLSSMQFIDNWEEVDDNIEIGTIVNERDNMNFFVAKMDMDNGSTIYLTQSIAPILNSVRQANILLLIVTVIFMFIAVIVAFLMSRNFTKPIREIQSHVRTLAKLEFDENLEVTTGDELQNLSNDINQLSFELENALATLKGQNKQLQRDIKSQRKFISNASHELRTPLALIKGYADEIAQGYVKNREQEHIYVGYIAEESTKMKRLLKEILELSRIQSGRMSVHPVNQDIKETIEGFIDKYSGFIDENGLNVKMRLIEGTGYFDSIRFEQILANYLSNAAKYSDSKKEVIIKLDEKKEVFRITVTNSGSPIPEDVMDFLWDGFYKADEARTANEGSYGLGLSIVKAIQELTGQAYGCYNKEGYVSFWFEVSKSN